MTMEMDNTSKTETKPSTDSSVESAQNVPAVKKPPGEIDPSEYEIELMDGNDMGLEVIIGDTSDCSIEERNSFFQRGLDYEKDEKPNQALQCYLACLKGLKNKTRFALLPECLKNIADIYHVNGEYEKAIHFAQAEKMFYETALIETQEIQRKIEEVTGNSKMDSLIPLDINDLNIEAMRAEEYEHLARLCLDNKQAQLALEYAGKCAKLRQKVYGSDHAKTKETLDFFASLYAEAGKEQYSDSVTFMADTDCGDNQEGSSAVPVVVESNHDSEEPVSILRQRSVASMRVDGEGSVEMDKEKKQVRFHESVDDAIKLKRKEEMVSLAITLLLLVVCFMVLISLGVWLFCTIDKSQTCSSVVMNMKSLFNTIHYNVNRLTSNPSQKLEYSR